MIKGLICSVVGGLVGATIWAIVSYSIHYEIGWIAWGIGGLVGFGMGVGAGDSRGGLTGVVAAIVALASICVGKFAAVHFMVKDITQEIITKELVVTDDDGKMMMAGQIAEEYEQAGKRLKWKDGVTIETASVPEDYPTDLWKDVEKRWAGMTSEHQEQYRASIRATREDDLRASASTVEQEGFLSTFGLFDLLWAFLAVGTAYKLGSGDAD